MLLWYYEAFSFSVGGKLGLLTRVWSVVTFQIKLIKDRDTGDSKGYAFVAFKTKEEAQKAIDDIHNKEFKVFVVLSEKYYSL